MNTVPSEQTVFAAALACATPAEREACLESSCTGDAALRQRVEALLRAAAEAGDFLEEPPAALSPGAAASALYEKAGDRIGRYRLLEQIGEGGCGIVYMAEQEEPVRRRVALKVIKPGMDTIAVVARFEAERQALAMMEHVNIARVFDGGATPAGRPFFVMELVRGVPITTYCDEAGLPTAGRLRLFLPVCQAVQHAHQKGIIHRDLKPSNILVTVNDGAAVPKVIDFGIAKATGERLTDKPLFTQFHAFMGTPAYTSPEQAEMSSVDIDTRSDIYSLGVLLYELLTSRTPFDGEQLLRSGLDEMRRVIRSEDPPRPSTRLGRLHADEATALSAQRKISLPALTSAVRGDLDWIVMKCLEKDRARRYETASGLAADVLSHLQHEPIAARPPGQLYRLRKLIRRNQGTFAALSGIALVLCAGTFVTIGQAARARRGEQLAYFTLAELRASAPAYYAQARELASLHRFAESGEKLDYAIRLHPTDIRYLLAQADLLECQLRFQEAAGFYRKVIEIEPAHPRATTHLALCHELIRPPGTPSTPQWEDALSRLYVVMCGELSRYGTEMKEISGLVLDHVRQKLRTPEGKAGQSLAGNLSLSTEGLLCINLAKTSLTDLTPLRGLPLDTAYLEKCKVSSVQALAGCPLRSLNISSTRVKDLTPLGEMLTLRNFSCRYTPVADLAPLRKLALRWVDLSASAVQDLSPLHGQPLGVLRIGFTAVKDLSPLAGLPLAELECTAIPATDFTPLAECSKLSYLKLTGTALKSLAPLQRLPLGFLYFDHTQVQDLAPLAGMPLLHLIFYNTPVTDLSALLKCPTLISIGLPRGVKNVELLRNLPNLRHLSYQAAADGSPAQTASEFWKEHDAAP